jgi:hypothetical protein
MSWLSAQGCSTHISSPQRMDVNQPTRESLVRRNATDWRVSELNQPSLKPFQVRMSDPMPNQTEPARKKLLNIGQVHLNTPRTTDEAVWEAFVPHNSLVGSVKSLWANQ